MPVIDRSFFVNLFARLRIDTNQDTIFPAQVHQASVDQRRRHVGCLSFHPPVVGGRVVRYIAGILGLQGEDRPVLGRGDDDDPGRPGR